MKLIVGSLLFISGCFFNHPQYCHNDDDCLNGQHCPTVRAPTNPPDICKGKAIINHNILAD